MGASYRVPDCQGTRAPGGTRTRVTALRVRYPCRWTTSACFSVDQRDLNPHGSGLRVRCAAASTLIPINRRGGSRTLDLTLIRGLLSPLSYAPANRAGGTRTQGTTRSVVRRIKSPVCCRYTTTLRLVGRICFKRVNIASLLILESCQVVALRIELSATRLSAAFGRPALDYRVPTSVSIESGWQDSK